MERSALTLKGLSYAPTGASWRRRPRRCPRRRAAQRNWDYRYTWIRDSSFMLRSFYRLGFDWEALEYFAFVIEAVDGRRRPLRAADHVRDRRAQGPHRTHARQPDRLARLAARARRQRRLGPAPERRVGDAPRRGRHPPAPGCGADRQASVGRAGQPGRHGDLARGRPGPGHLGDPGRPRTLHRIEGPVLGGHGPRRRYGPAAPRHRTRRAVARGGRTS